MAEPRENKMGVMPVKKLIITMSLPMMISMLVQALYNVVDSMFVARLSEDALTAVTLAFPMQNALISFAAGTGVGINALLSKSLGEKKFDRADALQLGVYMEYYRKRMMTEGDNPPIGILMCTEVGKELAEYIAPFIDERMFLTKYMLQLPSKETLTGFLKKENEGLPASEGK